MAERRKETGWNMLSLTSTGEPLPLRATRRPGARMHQTLSACIGGSTRMWLADTMLYCMSTAQRSCRLLSCGQRRGAGKAARRSWLALLGLSLVAPCLCLLRLSLATGRAHITATAEATQGTELSRAVPWLSEETTKKNINPA
ncbi:sprouty-related, EVH1 domain-containing protein 2-like protein [Lates japonicus]|uniref:Sprouty-related, EVH1 domain-containing protein 2-like protein n=1 Tax=Lates japonicus TaxID=270547 RepID=A0AAD3RJC3_LATJO|nr:sprouty-related, EVH1 domain-containing protein 2-like protein [Lates japonicus]